MEFEKIFNELYTGIRGCSLSWDARSKLSEEETKYIIYGELYFYSLIEIYKSEAVKPFLKNNSSFCDLGSGTGKIVIGTSLLLPTLSKYVGIELLKELFEKSNEVLHNLSEINADLAKKITFINDNFFNVDLSNFDMIFMHYPMKNAEEIYLQLEDKMKNELKTGSIVISIIRKLADLETFPCVDKLVINTDYGSATVYYHIKK